MVNRGAARFIGLVVTVIVLIAIVVYIGIRRSSAFAIAHDCVYSSPSVSRLIGFPKAVILLPLNTHFRFSGGGEGDATLTLLLRGSRGYAIAHAEMIEHGGVWNVSVLEIHAGGEDQKIVCTLKGD
jgi:hypothetical protein